MPTLVERVRAGDPDAVREAEAQVRGAGTDGAHELRQALVQHYTGGETHRRDAGVKHLGRDHEAALGHMRVLYSAFPEHSGFAVRFCTLLIATGRYDEAMASLGALRASAAGGSFQFEVNVLGAIARVHHIRGEFGRAAEILEQLVARGLEAFGSSPGGEQGRYLAALLARLSRAFVNTGDYARAVQVVEDVPHALRHPFLERTLRRARTLLRDGPPSLRSDARPVDPDRLTVACVKHGAKYGADYVNRLYATVRRNLRGDWRFVCLTDDADGLRPEVDVVDISGIRIHGWWAKLALFDPRVPLSDSTVLYLDLDTVVVGDLGFIEGLKVGFHIFEHPDTPCFNSSVMLFDRAFAAPVFERVRKRDIERLVGDQDWIEECLPGLDTFPHGLIRLYRGLDPGLDSTALARTGTRVVTFPTEPKPHQVRHGWVADHWG